MKNLTEITAIVRGYLDDDSAVVTQPILDAVNHLSNLFSIDSIDISQSTAVDGTTLDVPTDGLEIDTVFIDGEEIRKLQSLDDLQTSEDLGVQRWYEFGGKIQFVEAFTEINTTKIFYKKGYLEPTAGDDTDVPEKLMELVYVGAQYRYYNLLLSRLVLSKSDMPDIKPDELRKIRDDVKKNFWDLIKQIKINE